MTLFRFDRYPVYFNFIQMGLVAYIIQKLEYKHSANLHKLVAHWVANITLQVINIILSNIAASTNITLSPMLRKPSRYSIQKIQTAVNREVQYVLAVESSATRHSHHNNHRCRH